MEDLDGLYGNFDADPRVRGTQFEHAGKWFLENDPVYRAQCPRSSPAPPIIQLCDVLTQLR